MSNNKDLIIKNQLQVGASIDVTAGTVAQSSAIPYDMHGAVSDGFYYRFESQETVPRAIAFNDDGTKMYIMGTSGDDVNEYALSTAFDLSTVSYTTNFSVSSESTAPVDLFFKYDGTKFYIISSSNDTVFQYSMSTAWDISTASYDSVSFDISTQAPNPSGIAFSSDGTKMYVLDNVADSVSQFSLSTAWDISTASYDSVQLSLSDEADGPRGVRFNDTGTKMFIVMYGSSYILQYSLSTAWDLSTTSYVGYGFNTDQTVGQSIDSFPTGLAFNNDGTKMYVVGNETDCVYQVSTVLYPLVTSYDLGNVVDYGLFSGRPNTYDTDSRKFFISTDNTKIFLTGNSSGRLHELPLIDRYNIETLGTTNGNVLLTSYAANVRGGFFRADGLKYFSSHLTNNLVGEWTLSTAWDINTMTTANVSKSLSADVSSLDDVEFSSDGTKMIVTDIGEYLSIKSFTLSTAWDVTSATYDGDSASFNFGGNTLNEVTGIRFNSDGTILYVCGYIAAATAAIYQYNLTTAYDLSTITDAYAVYRTGGNIPRAVDFTLDGEKMFWLSNSGTDDIYQLTSGVRKDVETLDLSSGNYFQKTLDVTTEIAFSNPNTVQTFNVEITGSDSVTGGYAATSTLPYWRYLPGYYNGNRFDSRAQGDQLEGISLNEDGTRLYVYTSNSGYLYQYDLSVPYNISTAAYNGVYFDTSPQVATNARDIFFKPDGTAMYLIDNGTDSVYQYTLDTAWDVSTMSYANKSLSIGSEETTPWSLALHRNGTRLYIIGGTNDSVKSFPLPTPWDISSASTSDLASESFSVAAQTGAPLGLWFSYDGKKMYVTTTAQVETILIYELSRAWDPSSAVYSNTSYSRRNARNGSPYTTLEDASAGAYSMYITPDGTKMYLMPDSGFINQYEIGTLEAVTWPTSVKWVNGIQPPNPSPGQTDLYTFTTNDGGTTYFGQRISENIG